MNKKKNTSLTAKQRREQRNGRAEVALTDEEKAIQNEQQQQKKQKRKKLLTLVALITAGVLACTCICFGVAALFGAFDEDVNNELVNPYAVITLNSGDKLTIKLNWDDVNMRPTIANFIFLGETGFFNNTEFLSSSYNYLVMAGFTSVTETTATHRAKDTAYLYKIEKSFVSSNNRMPTWSTSSSGNFRLGYRLNNRSNAASTKIDSAAGWLAFMAGTGSTDSTPYEASCGFVLFADNNAMFPGGSTGTSKLNYFGRMTEESIAKVRQLCEKQRLNSLKDRSDWKSFEGGKIKSVKFTSLNKKLKGKIVNDFENFVLNNSNESGVGYNKSWTATSWRGHAGNFIHLATV